MTKRQTFRKTILEAKENNKIPMFYDQYHFDKNNKNRRWLVGTSGYNLELKWCEIMYKNGYTFKQIAESVQRSEGAVKQYAKSFYKSYNITHKGEKYDINDEFINIIKPNTLLDTHSGVVSFYNKYDNIETITSNDMNYKPRKRKNKKDNSYKLDAADLLQIFDDNSYDLVDVDPFGNAFKFIDDAIRIATKGIIFTYGEFCELRWGRKSCHYKDVENFYSLKDNEFSIDTFINKTIEIGRKHNKKLTPLFIKNWKGSKFISPISRVWFKIEEL